MTTGGRSMPGAGPIEEKARRLISDATCPIIKGGRNPHVVDARFAKKCYPHAYQWTPKKESAVMAALFGKP